MKIAGALFGFISLVVVLVFWYRAYRSIKGDDGPLFSMGSRKPRMENNSLEEFIAAYRRGEVSPSDGNMAAKPAAAVTPSPAVAPATSPTAAPATPVKRDAFVSGSTKLAYLACKTGLRDHHIFAHVPLPALSTGGAIDPALSRTDVDLLICNAAMSAVAAIDLIDSDLTDAGNGAASAAKADHLKVLGIRYLRLSAKSLPRPDELHALLYKM
jgi:hypothetical protein